MRNLYDCIIIGAGAAGLTAGIYASRRGLKTLIIEEERIGGAANLSYYIGNYPGFPHGIAGIDLMDLFYEGARSAGAEFKYETFEKFSLDGKNKFIKTNREVYKTKGIIIAAGAVPKRLKVKGEEEFIGRGVSFCTLCDGPEAKDKDILIVGIGDSAIDQCIYLKDIACKIYISTFNDQGKMDITDYSKLKLIPKDKLEILWNTKVCEFIGSEHLEKVKIYSIEEDKNIEMDCSYCFEFIGFLPNTKNLEEQLQLDSLGAVITDDKMETNIPGVFAIGDIRHKYLKQIVTAAADGAIAASSLYDYIYSN